MIRKMCDALKDNGVIYTSFKYGDFEGERDGRYFNDFTEVSFSTLLKEFPNLELQEVEVTTDVIPGRENVSWLNVIMKKIA